ncbi:MAG: hypothetical protein ACYC3X_13930 [Pirellulaceae bacterium]
MRSITTTLLLLLVPLCGLTCAGDPLPIASPGFSPSQVDGQGRLVEDGWSRTGELSTCVCAVKVWRTRKSR